VNKVVAHMHTKNVKPRIMVDCSHGNSQKKHENQPLVAAEVGRQVAKGSLDIFGLMIESHLNAGNQKHTPGQTIPSSLKVRRPMHKSCRSLCIFDVVMFDEFEFELELIYVYVCATKLGSFRLWICVQRI
jgi:hypothetical protein